MVNVFSSIPVQGFTVSVSSAVALQPLELDVPVLVKTAVTEGVTINVGLTLPVLHE